MEEEKNPETFTVTDKRRFVVDDSGTARTDGEPIAEKKQKPFDASPDKETLPREEKKVNADEERHVPLPEIDFSTFIFSLSSSALLHLGLIENPQTKRVERNLDLVKQTIDIIGMLKDKTQGNLSYEEENLIENLLTDLRLKYVNELSRK